MPTDPIAIGGGMALAAGVDRRSQGIGHPASYVGLAAADAAPSLGRENAPLTTDDGA